MAALPFLVMLAALFVIVFNFPDSADAVPPGGCLLHILASGFKTTGGPDTNGGCAQTWSCALLLTRARGASVRRETSRRKHNESNYDERGDRIGSGIPFLAWI
jgi:hypothetical protein